MDRPVLRGQPGEPPRGGEQTGSAPSVEPRWLSRLVLLMEGKEAFVRLKPSPQSDLPTSMCAGRRRPGFCCLAGHLVVSQYPRPYDATEFIDSRQGSRQGNSKLAVARHFRAGPAIAGRFQ
jgi:hypothetical protein